MIERLRTIREELKLSQDEFAKGLDLDRSLISKIEKGKAEFKDRHVKLICNTYNVNENWLRAGIGNKFTKDDIAKTPEERELLVIFRRLSLEMRQFFLNMGRDLVTKDEVRRGIQSEKGATRKVAGGGKMA